MQKKIGKRNVNKVHYVLGGYQDQSVASHEDPQKVGH